MSAALQVSPVGIEDDFFALGGDSILSIQIIARAKQAGITVTPAQLFQARTIKALSEARGAKTSDVDRYQALARELEADAVLDADIYPESSWSKDKFAPKQIFLTGATGFLGAFLLDALLKQTQANIYCLVRCDNARDGAEKIGRILESFNIWQPVYASRIEPVQGDLTKPLLGLSADQFHSLAANIDAVYHNGAAVNFIQPYATLKSANVDGTKEALRLACRVKAKPFHYVSTLSVFASVADRELISENDAPPLPISESNAVNGYAQSKWVAERLVMMARSRGLPVNIYRPGRIAGNSRTGVSNLSDFTSRFIKGCIQLGAIPDWNGAVNLVTVDYVSEALGRLLLQPDSLGRVFHFWHPQPARWQDLIDWLRSYGYAVKNLPYAEWRMGIENSVDNVLYPLLQTLPEAGFEIEHTIPEVNFEIGLEFDCRNTFEELGDTPVIPTPINAQLIDRYLGYFVAKGFLDAP
ncbi:MAG TPA: thioester reductase domain-containing protein [Pyrinomonadaceae bacterium]|nr:thioester reductase domain-containing protein [Pyrinomonadaceae bacterium]